MTTSTSVSVPCPDVLVPTADDLEEIIIFIGNQYGWEYIEPINEILGAFPLSHTWNKVDLDIPELEWEGKIQAMIEEFKLFPIIKIAEFLSVPLSVPIPGLGITVDCQRLIADPSYKVQLLKELEELGDGVLDLFLSKTSLENWDGTFGIDSPDIKLSKAWKEICEEIQKTLQSGGMSAMLKIVDSTAFEVIKEVLEEALPDEFAFFVSLITEIPKGQLLGGEMIDVDAIIVALRKQAEEAGQDLQEAILEYELPLVSDIPSFLGLEDVLPKTLGDLIDLDKTQQRKKIDMPNWNIQKLFERLKTFFKDLPQLLLEQVLLLLEAVEALISQFIPDEVFPPYTLCKFLTFLGFPKQISVSNLVLDGA